MRVGLCGACVYAKVVANRRGSRFHLCLRSRSDPSYPRYPRLPVLDCRGFEAADGSATDAPGNGLQSSSGDDG